MTIREYIKMISTELDNVKFGAYGSGVNYKNIITVLTDQIDKIKLDNLPSLVKITKLNQTIKNLPQGWYRGMYLGMNLKLEDRSESKPNIFRNVDFFKPENGQTEDELEEFIRNLVKKVPSEHRFESIIRKAEISGWVFCETVEGKKEPYIKIIEDDISPNTIRHSLGAEGSTFREFEKILVKHDEKAASSPPVGMYWVKLLGFDKEESFGIIFLAIRCSTLREEQRIKVLKGVRELLPLLHSECFNIAAMVNWKLNQVLVEANRAAALRTAIISVLVDSYSHNVSAHSLAALQWWFRIRAENTMLKPLMESGQKITVNVDKMKLMGFDDINLDDPDYINSRQSHYEQFENMDYQRNQSMLDVLWFHPYFRKIFSKQWFNGNGFTYFPVPLDFAIWPFFRYLRDKGAFWSGVINDNVAIPGLIISLYDLLWEGFICNPLYLGTIAITENIAKVNIHVWPGKDSPGGLHFGSVDLSIVLQEQMNDTALGPPPYSNLHFVRPGSGFKQLRSILSQPGYQVYLPGGVVGKQAFYTILENTLRNIKHYSPTRLQQIGKTGIDLHIKFRKVNVYNEKSTAEGTEEPLFAVITWLNHPLEVKDLTREPESLEDLFSVACHCGLYKEGMEKNEFVRKYYFLGMFSKLSFRALDSVADDEGRPRLSGNTQDQVCAGALLRNRFTHSELNIINDDKGAIQRFYYPFIFFEIDQNEKKIRFDFDFYDENKDKSTEGYMQMYQQYIKMQFESKPELSCQYVQSETEPCYLRRQFYIWRGSNLFVHPKPAPKDSADAFLPQKPNDVRTEDKRKARENQGRYKLVLVNTDEEFRLARLNGVVRLLHAGEVGNDLKFEDAYHRWLLRWVNKPYPVFQLIEKQNEGNRIFLKLEETGVVVTNALPENPETIRNITLAHAGEYDTSGTTCNLRFHGMLLGHLLRDIPFIELQKACASVKPDKLLELYETVATKILIADKRIFEKFNRHESGRKNGLQKTGVDQWKRNPSAVFHSLNLEVINEDKGALDFLTDEQRLVERFNIVIFHLSFIEALEGFEEKQNIQNFIKKHILQSDTESLPENFLLVITTGRGRSLWKEGVEESPYGKNVLHVPIEALEGCIENALALRDDFTVKYNIIKTIFGS